jgi:hypothetical protein
VIEALVESLLIILEFLIELILELIFAGGWEIFSHVLGKLRSLGSFVGGFGWTAVAAVCGAISVRLFPEPFFISRAFVALA